jgi:hypothetical protein
MRVYQNCSDHLFDKLRQVGQDRKSNYSNMEWPIMGGFVKDAGPKSYDIVITGWVELRTLLCVLSSFILTVFVSGWPQT